MGRFFCVLALCALLLFAGNDAPQQPAQPAFFSLLFPQLSPDFYGMFQSAATPGEAERLDEEVAWAIWL